ncbi:MAG: NAD(P)H-dependent flavin oxidoreductase [Candidatus Hermodarchaeota archaeon]
MVLKTEITEMFGIKHPIFAAPMGPFYTKELTVAVSEAGGMGVISHTNLLGKDSLKVMKADMEYVVEHTDKPFGFNIRTGRMQYDAKRLCRGIPKVIKENQRIREQCVYALTSAGTPRMLPENKNFQELRKNTNMKHFHVAPASWLADKCVASGVDGMVVTGTEGGGHQSYEKTGTFILLQKIKEKFPEVPLIACGAFGNGYGLAAALGLGAGAIAMGSRFIASKESEFHPKYKDLVPPADSKDTIIVTGFLGPIRLWRNEYALHHGFIDNRDAKIAEEQEFTLETLIEDGKHYETVYLKGDLVTGAIPLGQSCELIKSIDSVPDIIESTVKVAEEQLKKASQYIQ